MQLATGEITEENEYTCRPLNRQNHRNVNQARRERLFRHQKGKRECARPLINLFLCLNLRSEKTFLLVTVICDSFGRHGRIMTNC